MVEQHPSLELDPEGPDEGESGGFDLDQARELVGFVLRATRRRLVLAVVTFLVVATLGLTVAATMPRTYSAQTKLLAQRSSAVRVVSGSNLGMDSVDNPTKNVAAMILRRDNLVALARDAHLVEQFEATRPPALRLKDHVIAAIFGPMSDEDKQKMMVGTLESKIDVTVTEESIVTIALDWSNPQIVYDLIVLVEKNFLESRYDSEVAAINDSIDVLEEHARSELKMVDAQLDEYQKVVAERTDALRLAKGGVSPPGAAAASGPLPRSPAIYAVAGPAVAASVDPDLTKELEEKRLQIKILEETQRRSLEAMRQQLAQAQLTLTPMHPTVISLQQKVDAMSQPSPELRQLQAEERALIAQLVQPLKATTVVARHGAAEGTAPLAIPAAALGAPDPYLMARDGPLQLAQSKLAAAITAYQGAMARIDAARAELDVTKAVYKHRYTVVTPAERPAKPKKATAQVVGISSIVGGALLALLLAAALDLVGGRVLEPWQVRRRLKLDVLAELDRPR